MTLKDLMAGMEAVAERPEVGIVVRRIQDQSMTLPPLTIPAVQVIRVLMIAGVPAMILEVVLIAQVHQAISKQILK